jgi:DNA-binding NtrC family response regulator
VKHELEIRKVLIIDDEPGLRDALTRVMRGQNIQTVEAENGPMALEILKNQEFQAVLCDIMMPDMSGLDCLTQAQSQGIMTPFVFVTGYSDSDRMLQAIRLGAVDFISKPFDNTEILDVLFRVMEIGIRKKRINKEIEGANSYLSESIKKEERMISLMRASNNKKRAG